MKKFLKPSGYGLLAAVVLLLSGCHTVPETGRTQLMLMPLGQEIGLGQEAFQQIRAQEKVSTNQEQLARLERVGRRIAAQAAEDMPEADWEFVLFEGDTLNAFALPGGKIGFYEGMMELADTDDMLAAVMGHEVAHVTARHGAARMSRAMALSAGALAVGVAARDRPAEQRQAIMLAYGLGATVGIELPYSRQAESEADKIGILYAARAGYDPRAAITFWERMSEAARGPRPPALLSTHPADERRIQDLQAMMPEALEEYQRGTAQVN
jgi:metalloendopeptidase OMA1, mitochondrial